MIRIGKKEDAEDIAKLKIENYKVTYKGIFLDTDLEEMSIEREKEKYIRGFNSRKILVYEEEGKICGYVYYGKRKNNVNILEEYKGEIYAIYVDISMKGKGIGTKLIKSALSNLVDEYEKVILWCATDNGNSIKFYESKGFVPSIKIETDMGKKSIFETAFVLDFTENKNY